MGGGAGRDILIGLGGLVIVFILLLFGAVGMYQMVYGDRVILGVKAMGLDLSGDTAPQSRARLQARFDQYAATSLTIRDGSKEWKATPTEIGLRFDPTRLVDDAMNAGRSGGLAQRVFDQLGIYRQGRTIDATFSIDEQQRNTFFARLAIQIDQEVM